MTIGFVRRMGMVGKLDGQIDQVNHGEQNTHSGYYGFLRTELKAGELKAG